MKHLLVTVVLSGLAASAMDAEHLRLLFRKSEVAVLRQRIQTPEGKAIVAQPKEVIDAKEKSLVRNLVLEKMAK